MPFFLAALVPVIELAAGTAATAVAMDAVRAALEATAGKLAPYAMAAAFERMGLVIDPEKGFNDASITEAINAGPLAGSGVVLESVLNRDALLRGLEALAVARAADSLGLVGVSSLAGLRDGLRDLTRAELVAQVEAGAGSVVDGAPDSRELVRILDAVQLTAGNAATDFTKKGISNRARQARYRAQHSRVWVAR